MEVSLEAEDNAKSAAVALTVEEKIGVEIRMESDDSLITLAKETSQNAPEDISSPASPVVTTSETIMHSPSEPSAVSSPPPSVEGEDVPTSSSPASEVVLTTLSPDVSHTIKVATSPEDSLIACEMAATPADSVATDDIIGNVEGSSSTGDIVHEGNEESVLPSMGILPSESPVPPSVAQGSPTNEEGKQISDTQKMPSTVDRELDPAQVVHKMKRIKWQDIEVPIITQNNNGPCPLLAIVNVLILKGQITLPSDRNEITGGDLVLIIGNALFDQPRNNVPAEMRRYVEQNTEDAISILHKLLTGLDVNVKFSGVRDFEFTTELCVFDLLGIPLYHGWVVDPGSEAASVVGSLSYNQLTNNIFAWREEAVKTNDNDLLLKAMLCEEFMTGSLSQLTIHGLFELASSVEKEEIAVLFRNNHFSTIYKKGEQLYQLLTDQGFLHENMVWETLSDVDATFSEFVSATFQPIQVATENQDPQKAAEMTTEQQISSDEELAAMMQREQEQQQKHMQSFEKLKEDLGLQNLSDEEMAKRLQEEENRLAEAEAAAAATARPTSPHTSQHHPSTTHHDDKKKKDVSYKKISLPF
ncbi:unnamed protein product [Meganyctiphanes norvegica]|uniref:Ubiquitin carboxyl-terminal hydrolase n=1 Tax=Meganyctiphanes norvegica TaxID=48144 RepID=A0AAV2PMV0_MEGNR